MNVPELEHIKVKSPESEERQSAYCVEYLNQPFYKDLRDTIISQIGSCERLLVKTKSARERNTIEREILILKLILDLLEY
jgi:hypothetical protein